MDRNFKGVWIPKEIWLSKELTLQEKVFLVEIESLDNEEGCFASNEYFANFFGLSKDRARKIIASLKEKGFIDINFSYKAGTKEIEKRIIRVLPYGQKQPYPWAKTTIPMVENDHTPMVENDHYNNTLVNNTINNTINNNTVSLQDKKAERIQKIFDHWVSKKIVEHRKLTSGMKSKINARLKENTLEDLLKAIDNYAAIRDSKNHWYSYKFTLDNFMSEKNINKFLDIADPFNNFKVTKREYGKSYPRGVDHGKDEAAKRFAADNGIPF